MTASPAFTSAAKNALAAQQRIAEITASPGFTAAINQTADFHKRLREQFAQVTSSPGFVSAAKSALAAQQAIREMTASPAFTSAAKNALAAQQRIAEITASPGFTAAATQAMAFQKRLGEQIAAATASPGFTAAIKNIAGAIRNAQQWISEWEESERRILELLAPRGWMISPTTSLHEVHGLLALADTDGIGAVESALVAALTPTRCRGIVEDVFDRDSFLEWKDVLDQAIAAHEEGKYALSVPVWLLVFEGIWRVELGVDGIFSRITKRRGAVVRTALPHSRPRLRDALIRVIQTVAEQLALASTTTPDGLRRHVVLHGRDPKYGTEKASVQGILMLEALHYHLQQSETRQVDSTG
jgi:hypothetical protein